ncbi:hypothetical protein CLOBE_25070 [Clostridium beijerinckii]|nr:hypothetical protein CLOBE_25070 [Clostridium beijerinckii]
MSVTLLCNYIINIWGERLMENNCTISIMPETSKVDEPVTIKISGLLKNERVLIRIFKR